MIHALQACAICMAWALVISQYSHPSFKPHASNVHDHPSHLKPRVSISLDVDVGPRSSLLTHSSSRLEAYAVRC